MRDARRPARWLPTLAVLACSLVLNHCAQPPSASGTAASLATAAAPAPDPDGVIPRLSAMSRAELAAAAADPDLRFPGGDLALTQFMLAPERLPAVRASPWGWEVYRIVYAGRGCAECGNLILAWQADRAGIVPPSGRLSLVSALAARTDGQIAHLNGRAFVNPDRQQGPEAVIWFERALSQNVRSAALQLGELYFRGTAVPRDVPRAQAYFEDALRRGVSAASRRLADALSDPDQPAPDIDRALSLYAEAAEADASAQAAYRVGVLTERRVVDRQMSAAEGMPIVLSSYMQAIEGGVRSAGIRLGDLYAAGRLVPRDIGAARLYYTLAQDLDHPEAAERIRRLARQR